MPEDDFDDSDLINRLKDVFKDYLPNSDALGHQNYPKEALPVGTIVRSITHDRLGAISDAFYGDLDKDNKKIIIYTILLFPEAKQAYGKLDSNRFYVSNEYEYDIVAFLMMPKIDMKELASSMNLGVF